MDFMDTLYIREFHSLILWQFGSFLLQVSGIRSRDSQSETRIREHGALFRIISWLIEGEEIVRQRDKFVPRFSVLGIMLERVRVRAWVYT